MTKRGASRPDEGAVARSAHFRRWRAFPVVMLGTLFVLTLASALLSSNAHATGLLSATITGPSNSSAPCTLNHLTSENYASALSDLNNATTNCSPASLPIGPNGLASLSATSLVVGGNASSTTPVITMQGNTTLFGLNAQILIVGQWTSATDTSPDFSVIVRFDNVNLSSLVAPSSTSTTPGVGLTSVWLAFTSHASGTSVDPSTFSDPTTSILPIAMNVSGSGVSFRAVPSASGDFATALSTLGVDPASIELDGSLSASVSGLSATSAPSVTAGLSISANAQLNVPTQSWLKVAPSATISVQGASNGTWSVSASSTATLGVGSTTYSPTVTFSVVKDSTGVTVDLSAALGTVNNAFGQSWLTLNSLTLDGTLSTSGGATAVSGSLAASATVSGNTFNVSVSLGTTSGLSVQLSSTASISTADIASALGLTLPSGTPTASIGDVAIDVQVPISGSPTVAVSGTASVSFGSGQPLSADLLIRVHGSSILVAARPTGQLTFDQLTGLSLSPDLTLPTVSVIVSSAPLAADSGSLDAVTNAFFQPVMCDPSTPDCSYTLNVASGLGLVATVTLPSSLDGLLSQVHIKVSGPLVIDGQFSLSGPPNVDLTVHLPVVTVNSGPIEQVALSLNVAASADSFTFSLQGDFTLVVAGTSGQTCPNGVNPQGGDVCLDFSVDARVSLGPSGATVDLKGVLSADQGWTLAKPKGITIYALAIDVGISSADGGSVNFGARGSVTFGNADLTVAMDLAISTSPPWLIPQGFTIASHSGLSMSDLTDLYHQVTGQTVSTTVLPPLALRNLYLSFSTIDNPSLCLQKGFYLSADLVIASGTGAGESGTQPPPCLPPSTSAPDASKACASDSSCLATVLLAINPDAPSITGAGFVTGFTAGPLSMDPTDLQFTLDTSTVQVYISGGGQLVNPAQWAAHDPNPSVWAQGSLTLSVGTQNLLLDGSVTIGQLSGHVHATGSLNLSDPGFNLTDWFSQTQQFFTTAGQRIDGSMQTVSNTVNTWYQTYVQTGTNAIMGDINSAYGSLNTSGPQQWQDLWNLYNSVSASVNSINSTLDNLKLSSLDISTDTIVNDALHGIDFPGWKVCVKNSCLTIVPAWSIPGLCTYDPAVEGTSVCTMPFNQFIAAARQQYADPQVSSALSSEGLSLPNGASDQSVVTGIHAIDPPSPGSITCAMATANFSAGTVSPATIEANSLGHSVTFAGPSVESLSNSTNNATNDTALSQDTFNSLYSGKNTGACTTPTSTFNVAPLTLSLDHSWIHEGETTMASGYVEDSSITQVQLDWGDGTITTATVKNGRYSASHVYADESTTNGLSSPFLVRVSVVGASAIAPLTQQISVLDAALGLDGSLVVTPAVADLMTPVTVSGVVALVEFGEPVTVTLTWGDGATSIVTTASDGSFDATHTYLQLAPPGHPSQVEPIEVSFAEVDGTAGAVATSVTVNDVAPANASLYPVGGALFDQGTVFTHVGTTVVFDGGVQSITPRAGPTFNIDWADGSVTVAPVLAPSGGPLDPGPIAGWYPYSLHDAFIAHVFANACLFRVATTVTDEDTLSAPTVMTPVVATQPLGAQRYGAGNWLHQLDLSGHSRRGAMTTAQWNCYLAIASYIAPPLANGSVTLSQARTILSPAYAGLSATDLLASQVRRDLLTSLLNFANGAWDWNAPLGPSATAYSVLVTQANQALTSMDPVALSTVHAALSPIS